MIILFAFIKKVPCFDTFLEGAKQGLISTYKIAPSLIGLIVAVNMLKASGALEMLIDFIRPAAEFLGFPAEVVPLALLRPVSGSGSTAILNSILQDYGPDSFIGRAASVMAGSTETTFYAIAVYYGAVGIKKNPPYRPCCAVRGFCRDGDGGFKRAFFLSVDVYFVSGVRISLRASALPLNGIRGYK